MGSKEVKGGKGEDVAGFLLGLFVLPLAYLVWSWGNLSGEKVTWVTLLMSMAALVSNMTAAIIPTSTCMINNWGRT